MIKSPIGTLEFWKKIFKNTAVAFRRVLLVPALFTLFIYTILSPGVCFNSIAGSGSVAQKILSEQLLISQANIQMFAPIVQFGSDWFRYDVSILNNFRIAIEERDTKRNTEFTSDLVVMTAHGTTTIPYGSRATIANGVSAKDVGSVIQQGTYLSKIKELTFSPYSDIEFQTNNSWPLNCINIQLQWIFFPLVFFVVLGFYAGFLALLKQLVQVYKKGVVNYFDSD